MNSNTKKKEAKRLYIQGNSIENICTILHISRPTFYYYKKLDNQKGIDWDDLAYAKALNKNEMLTSEKEFLTTLIRSFEDNLKAIEEIEDVDKRLKLLERYSNSYYKLKAPSQKDCKTVKAKAIEDTISKICDIAQRQKDTNVFNFLSNNAELILEEVSKI